MTDLDDTLKRIQNYTAENLPAFRLRESAEQKARSEYADLVPDLASDDPDAREIDELLSRVDVATAYRRWCKKAGTFDLKIGNRSDGIMIRCPIPGHTDKTPSASMNVAKDVWHCHGCEQGGDVYDLAAWHFGYRVPDYKTGSAFRRLRQDMAEDLGLVITRDGEVVEPKPDPLPEAPTAPLSVARETAPSDATVEAEAPPVDTGTVLQLVPEMDDDQSAMGTAVPWESLVARGTFLWSYMIEADKDSFPTNFHLFNGLMLLSMANGRYCRIDTGTGSIAGNIYVCLYGGTASGKTQTWSLAKRILRNAVPYDSSAPSSGARLIGNPASPEGIHDAFHKVIEDPLVGEETYPVNGVVYSDEFASILSRRAGNDVKPILTEFYSASGPESRTKAGGHDVTIEEPFCSFLTGTQPRAIRVHLAQQDADSGFLNRIIFAHANPKPPRSMLDGTKYDERTLVDTLRRVWVWSEKNAQTFEFTEDAAEMYREFWARTVAPAALVSDDELKAFTARIEMHLFKIMLLMAVNEEEVEISAELVQRVCSIVYPVLAQGYEDVKSDIERDDTSEDVKNLVTYIGVYVEKHGYPPSARDLNRSTPLRRLKMTELRNVITLAEDLGLVRREIFKTKSTTVARFHAVQ